MRITSLGYSKVMKDNKVVVSAAQIGVGDDVYISMIDGNVGCKVLGVKS